MEHYLGSRLLSILTTQENGSSLERQGNERGHPST
jgi:hypothetical protein